MGEDDIDWDALISAVQQDPSLMDSLGLTAEDLSSMADSATQGLGGAAGWVSGQDLAGGADTGLPVGAGSSMNITPGLVNAGTSLAKLAGGSGGASQAGTFTNPDGSINWTSLLSTLAPLLGAGLTANATSKATQQQLDATNKATDQVTSLLGNNSQLYAPYVGAGQQALQMMQQQAANPSNLASRYRPLGTGAGLSLANVARGG